MIYTTSEALRKVGVPKEELYRYISALEIPKRLGQYRFTELQIKKLKALKRIKRYGTKRMAKQKIPTLFSQQLKDRMTAYDIQKYFKVCPATIRNWVKRGDLVTYKENRIRIFYKRDILKFLAERPEY